MTRTLQHILDKPRGIQSVTFVTVSAGVLLLVAVIALQVSGSLVLDSGDLNSVGTRRPGIQGSDGGAVLGATSPKISSASWSARAPEVDAPSVVPDGLPASAEVPSPAAGFIAVSGLVTPQTYVARIHVFGWRSESSRTLEIDVESARLAGPIDALTGAELGEPASSEKDYSSLLVGQRVLASASPTLEIDAGTPGSVTVRLVLVPSGTGAVLVIDRLES